MVWFSCESCGDSIKKVLSHLPHNLLHSSTIVLCITSTTINLPSNSPVLPKLQAHVNQCAASRLTCIDCNHTFDQNGARQHNSCVTEHQKYAEGATKPGGIAANGLASPGGNPQAGSPPRVAGAEYLASGRPWICRLCNVTCTSYETLEGHAGGLKHIRKVKAAAASNGGASKGVSLEPQNAVIAAPECTPKLHPTTVEEIKLNATPQQAITTSVKDPVTAKSKKRKGAHYDLEAEDKASNKKRKKKTKPEDVELTELDQMREEGATEGKLKKKKKTPSAVANANNDPLEPAIRFETNLQTSVSAAQETADAKADGKTRHDNRDGNSWKSVDWHSLAMAHFKQLSKRNYKDFRKGLLASIASTKRLDVLEKKAVDKHVKKILNKSPVFCVEGTCITIS